MSGDKKNQGARGDDGDGGGDRDGEGSMLVLRSGLRLAVVFNPSISPSTIDPSSEERALVYKDGNGDEGREGGDKGKGEINAALMMTMTTTMVGRSLPAVFEAVGNRSPDKVLSIV